MLKRNALLPILLIVSLLFAACSQTPQSTQLEKMQVADGRGEMVELSKNPERIIAVDPALCDIIYALGEQDRLVAVGSYCEQPPEVEQKQKVGAYSDLNVEEVVALNPQLILFGTMSTDDVKYDALKSAGIEVIALGQNNIEQVYANIETLGGLLNCDAKAKEVKDVMQNELDAIEREGSAKSVKLKVFVEISPLEYGLYSCGAGTFQDELIEMIGAENIFGSESGWIAISEEQVVSLNPDVIISTTMYEGYDPVAEISSRPGWEGVTAVQNGRIHYIDPTEISLASPFLTQGAQSLYDAVYGQ